MRVGPPPSCESVLSWTVVAERGVQSRMRLRARWLTATRILAGTDAPEIVAPRLEIRHDRCTQRLIWTGLLWGSEMR